MANLKAWVRKCTFAACLPDSYGLCTCRGSVPMFPESLATGPFSLRDGEVGLV